MKRCPKKNRRMMTAGEINIKKFKMGKMQDAMSYPRWMERVAFGSKTLPASPCMIGDAQPDRIKMLLLQIGRNLY